MGWNNKSLFVDRDPWVDDFWDERIVIDDYSEDNDLLDIDPYRWEVVKETTWILDKNKSCEEPDFEKVEIDWKKVEYKIIVKELLNFNEATKRASNIWARLPNEEEFNGIFEAIWIEEFNKYFPGVLYSDSEKTIWSKGGIVYFWLKEFSWTEVKVKVIYKDDSSNIYNNTIWKQYGACMIVIR